MNGFPNRHLQYRLECIERKLDLILVQLGISEPEESLDVFLVNYKHNKLRVVKSVKSILNCTLLEAKTLVDKAPIKIVSNRPKLEADLVLQELLAAGGKAEIRPHHPASSEG